MFLNLFSRARWRENRTIFNTPNPRLANASLLKEVTTKQQQQQQPGSRRGSLTKNGSRQPSLASIPRSLDASGQYFQPSFLSFLLYQKEGIGLDYIDGPLYHLRAARLAVSLAYSTECYWPCCVLDKQSSVEGKPRSSSPAQDHKGKNRKFPTGMGSTTSRISF